MVPPFFIIIMKRIAFVTNFICFFILSTMAQNNAVTIKLLSSEPNEISGENRPSTFEYDDNNRVSRIVQTNKDGEAMEISVSYSDNSIIVNNSRERYEATLQNGHIVEDIQYRQGRTSIDEIYTYTYDSNGKIIHINREVPPETSRNTTYDLTWENGLLTKCIATKTNDGTITEITYTYTDIEDRTLANFFCSPFEYITNYETGESRTMPLLDCHGFYGWQSTRLLESVTKVSKGNKSEYIFSYERDNGGRVSVITYNYYKNGNNNQNIKTTLYWDGSSLPTTEDLPETDNNDVDYGNSDYIDENTNLNGNIIGNVYYNISSENGGYNAVEGCIEITKPTDDDDIDGKDIFGEDFKNHYAGIVFKVAAGSGTIKLKAETTGSMMLKVKVGSNEPYEMMLTGKVEAKIPYSVTQPTYIYVYASSLDSSSPSRAGSTGSALKIYGLSWDDTTGIIENKRESEKDNIYYTIDGRKLNGQPTKKGVYIVNKQKVMVE